MHEIFFLLDKETPEIPSAKIVLTCSGDHLGPVELCTSHFSWELHREGDEGKDGVHPSAS